MKTFLSNTFAKWFKRLGFAGAFRWRLLYWTYKIWPGLHIRDAEWDWVLNYLPSLNDWQKITVLDVGATSSLLIYELDKRGYITTGIDLRPYQERLPKRIDFYVADICSWQLTGGACYDFVICISVLEHIEKQKEALEDMIQHLKPGGRLLLTIPTMEYAQGHPWEGFSIQKINNMIPPNAAIIEYTERKGQSCIAIVKE